MGQRNSNSLLGGGDASPAVQIPMQKSTVLQSECHFQAHVTLSNPARPHPTLAIYRNMEAVIKEVERALGGELKRTLDEWWSTTERESDALEEIKKKLYLVRARIGSSAPGTHGHNRYTGGGPQAEKAKLKIDRSEHRHRLEEHQETSFENVYILMKKILAELMNRNKIYEGVWFEVYGRGTPMHRKWEYFATALLPRCKLFEDETAVYRYPEHCGGPNDKGTDVLLYSSRGSKKPEVVVQVKGGRYFESGKGNSIVLSLVGSCVYHGVRRGIIFSSESRAKLTQNTETFIEEFQEEDTEEETPEEEESSEEEESTEEEDSTEGEESKGYIIQCLFKKDIERLVNNLSTRDKAEVLKRFRSWLNKP